MAHLSEICDFYVPLNVFCHLYVLSADFKTFSHKNSAFSAACHIQNYKKKKLLIHRKVPDLT